MGDLDLERLQETIANWIEKANSPKTKVLKYILEMAYLEADNLRAELRVSKSNVTSAEQILNR